MLIHLITFINHALQDDQSTREEETKIRHGYRPQVFIKMENNGTYGK